MSMNLLKVYKVHCDVKEEVREAFMKKHQANYQLYDWCSISINSGNGSYQDLISTTAIGLEEELDKSIAVLPFKNLSPDEENQYFADGATRKGFLTTEQGKRPSRCFTFFYGEVQGKHSLCTENCRRIKCNLPVGSKCIQI